MRTTTRALGSATYRVPAELLAPIIHRALRTEIGHEVRPSTVKTILDQAAVHREADDTLETFTAKIHAAEHLLLPAVIARLSAHGAR